MRLDIYRDLGVIVYDNPLCIMVERLDRALGDSIEYMIQNL